MVLYILLKIKKKLIYLTTRINSQRIPEFKYTLYKAKLNSFENNDILLSNQSLTNKFYLQ